MTAIDVSDLSKSYRDVTALRNVSFQVEEGSIFGFLGPNGAGKSTAIGILLQFLRPDAGQVRIFGEDVYGNVGLKRRISVIPDADLPRINGLRLLKHTARYYGYRGQELRTQVAKVVKMAGAREYVGRSTASLSKGQKTRIKIANALVSDPELVIADEPTSGLDPFARKDFLDLITTLVRDEGKTVFFSSHVIGEVEKVCDDLLMLNRGRVVAKGTLSEISQSFPTSGNFSLRASGLSVKRLEELDGVFSVERTSQETYLIRTERDNGTPSFLKVLVEDPKVSLHSFGRESMDLERIFMQTVEESGL